VAGLTEGAVLASLDFGLDPLVDFAVVARHIETLLGSASLTGLPAR
jgi:hypothetical protein